LHKLMDRTGAGRRRMADAAEIKDRNGIQVIARAAAILRALKDHRDGLSLGQIAERVGLPRSTVQRIVGALQTERLVMSASPEGGIRLGPELQSLAAAARIDLAELIRPYLQDLSRETEETVDLAVLRGNQLIFIDQIPGTQRLRAVSSVGEVFPLATTANGKASLALMDDEMVTRVVRAEWRQDGVDGDVDKFLAEIRKIRKAGLAYDLDEHTEGISAVGMAFRDAQGGVYAISVPTPSARFEARRRELSEAIMRLSGRIARVLQMLKG